MAQHMCLGFCVKGQPKTMSRRGRFSKGRLLERSKDFIIPSQQSWRGYSSAAVRGWLGESVSGFVGGWVRGCVRGFVSLYLIGHESDFSFCPITFKFHMHIYNDESRNRIDFWVTGSKVKVNWHFVYKTLWTRYRLQFFPHSLSNFTCTFTMMRGVSLLILGSWGQRSRSTFTLWDPVHTIQITVFAPIHFNM